MPTYVKFIQNGVPLRGALRSGAHAGWTELLSFTFGRQPAASTPGVSEIVVTKLTDATSPLLARQNQHTASASMDRRWFRSRTGHQLEPLSNRPNITAEVDFTRADGRGSEITVLRTLVHGVRIVSCEPVARTGRGGNDIAMEKLVIVHEGFTRAGEPTHAPDITQQVHSHLQMYDFPGE